MKKSKGITLLIAPILSTVLLNACDSNESTSRDVYQTKEECVKDWGDQDLCEEMNDNDSNDYRKNGGVFISRPIWGPPYYPNQRSVSYKGRTFAPTTKSSSMPPYIVTSRSSSTSRSSVSSPTRSSSTTYGGFGSRSGGSSSSS
ncbi:MAG TPA: hypothetical protein PKY82_11360 [Pyrinomonadaceae bacterium]|nr:hypothetical protein [Pyrinomonadaceae bacterium]